MPAESGSTLYLDFHFVGLRVFGECDGRSKYTDPILRGSRTAEEVVYAEKRRHDWIVGTTGMRVIRWGAADVRTAARFADRLRAFGVPVPGRPGGFNYSESVTLHARVSDLADPSAIRVPCATHFTNIVDWRPWMNMDGHPGHLTALGAGRYGVALEDLPETWLAATRERWPQYLENPGSLLDPVWPPA